MALKLELAKDGQQPKSSKLTLGLKKGDRFTVELFWDSPHDLDGHALLATNNGSGAKVDDLAQVLSTYNLKKNDPTNGVLNHGADGMTFSLPGGELSHSGDARTGVNVDIDEIITIDGGKITGSANEIPIVVTIHGGAGITFGQVNKAGIRLKDSSGKTLGEYELTTEFAGFNAVQMGSLILGPNGWEFAPVGAGFNGDFGTVLNHFS